MRQIFVGGNGADALNNAATEYTTIYGRGSTITWSATSTLSTLIAEAGTFRNFKVKLSAAPGAGTSWTFTVMKNGSATSLQVVISGASDTEGLDSANEVSFAVGDRIALRAAGTNTPANVFATGWSLEFEATAAQRFIMSSEYNVGFTVDGTRKYSGFHGLDTFNTASETGLRNQTLVPLDGTIRSLYIRLGSSPGSGKSCTFSIYKNGAEEASSQVTIANSATTGNVTGLSIDIAPGDQIMLSVINPGTSFAISAKWGISIEPQIQTAKAYLRDRHSKALVVEQATKHSIMVVAQTGILPRETFKNSLVALFRFA